MTEEKIQEIKKHAEELITENCDKHQVAKDIEVSYIFGEQSPEKAPYNYGTSEHYQFDDILTLVNQKYEELYPTPVEEIIP